jgi:hypothetical protein
MADLIPLTAGEKPASATQRALSQRQKHNADQRLGYDLADPASSGISGRKTRSAADRQGNWGHRFQTGPFRCGPHPAYELLMKTHSTIDIITHIRYISAGEAMTREAGIRRQVGY